MLLDMSCSQKHIQLMIEAYHLVEHLGHVRQVVFAIQIPTQAPLHQLYLAFERGKGHTQLMTHVIKKLGTRIVIFCRQAHFNSSWFGWSSSAHLNTLILVACPCCLEIVKD